MRPQVVGRRALRCWLIVVLPWLASCQGIIDSPADDEDESASAAGAAAEGSGGTGTVGAAGQPTTSVAGSSAVDPQLDGGAAGTGATAPSAGTGAFMDAGLDSSMDADAATAS